MFPRGVSNSLPASRRRRLVGITICPLIPNEKIVLLAPHHAGKSLPLNVSEIIGHGKRADVVVKVIGLLSLLLDHLVELFLVEVGVTLFGELETDDWLKF